MTNKECASCRLAAGDIAGKEGVDASVAYRVIHMYVHTLPDILARRLRRLQETDGRTLEVRDGTGK